MVFRVSVIATPSTLGSVLESGCDGVVLDIADEHTAPGEARTWARGACARAAAAGKHAIVRVNHPRSGLMRDDLEALVGAGLDNVILPHAAEPQDVRDLAVVLREFEHGRDIEPGTIGVLPTVDTSRGLLRAFDVAGAAPRVRGLLFDGARYAQDIGARDEEWGPRLAYARGALVAAARATDGLPFVVGNGVECRQLAHYGFAGIVLTGPTAVASAVAAFTPPEQSIGRARQTVESYEAARTEGAWVGRLDGTVLDGHSARKARRLLEG